MAARLERVIQMKVKAPFRIMQDDGNAYQFIKNFTYGYRPAHSFRCIVDNQRQDFETVICCKEITYLELIDAVINRNKELRDMKPPHVNVLKTVIFLATLLILSLLVWYGACKIW